MDGTGPIATCASCLAPGRVHVHTAQGWICRRCYGEATTVIETRWIKGKRFDRCLKGLQPKAERPAAATAGLSRKEV